uniref:Uncharacterized protein n=1 Tax=Thermodesulfobacterium geofontis TaxID=1295609 RepID=A0A7V4JQI8_9BACT
MLLTSNIEKRKEFCNKILKVREAYRECIEFLKAKIRSKGKEKELNKTIYVSLNLEKNNNRVVQFILVGETEEAIPIHEQKVLPQIRAMQKELDDFVNFYAKRADELADKPLGYIKRTFAGLIVSEVIFLVVLKFPFIINITKQFSANIETQIEKTTQMAMQLKKEILLPKL